MTEETAESIITLHTFRNEVYHVGVQACDVLSDFDPSS
jgi:hypothetical protein